MNQLQGIAASRGIAIGPAFRFREAKRHIERRTVADPAAEWARLEAALAAACEQLGAAATRASAAAGAEQAAIFQAHTRILEDPEWLEAVRAAIEGETANAEAALNDTAEAYARKLEALDSERHQARAADVRDVAARVLEILLGVEDSPTDELATPSVVLARDLTPSDTIRLDRSLVLGFCTADGSATSHTTILARGLGLPAVVGAGPHVLEIRDGTALMLNGGDGTVVVEPNEEIASKHQARRNLATRLVAQARSRAQELAVTRDGHHVKVFANIGNIEEAQCALEAGAEGVGLLRTEFLYLDRTHVPDEEEQYQAYRAVADLFGDRPVILRTLDIGGDKAAPYLSLPTEKNPFLGLRAIRLSLARPDLFRPQLRAALRAGAGRNLKMMFPMVSTIAEIREAREALEECRAALRAEGCPVAEEIEVGIMVETPAAALMADRLASEVDFFSIGTNDLSQYTMAADRTNARVAQWLVGVQPAVLRLVHTVIAAAHAQGVQVGLCGELAGVPLAIPLLLGLGLDELSMNAPAIPVAKQIIRALTLDETREVAVAALELDSPQAIEELVREQVPAVGNGWPK